MTNIKTEGDFSEFEVRLAASLAAEAKERDVSRLVCDGSCMYVKTDPAVIQRVKDKLSEMILLQQSQLAAKHWSVMSVHGRLVIVDRSPTNLTGPYPVICAPAQDFTQEQNELHMDYMINCTLMAPILIAEIRRLREASRIDSSNGS